MLSSGRIPFGDPATHEPSPQAVSALTGECPLRKPRLLDLFCGAGGAATGYAEVGFEVVGVDHRPQPRYPFELHQADAMTFPLDGFDAIHASPLWYAFTALAKSRGFRADDPDDVTPIYNRLRASGLPFVVESGSLGPLRDVALFCGPAHGLQCIRHMYFASNVPLAAPPCACVRGGAAKGFYVAYKGSYGKGRVNPPRRSRREWTAAAELVGMTWREAHLAVPPAYTRHIGRQLLAHLFAQQSLNHRSDDLTDSSSFGIGGCHLESPGSPTAVLSSSHATGDTL